MANTNLTAKISFTPEETEKIVNELKMRNAELKARALHAEMTVSRMLKFGNKYISEAWDTYDERIERKQVWDAIISKWNNGDTGKV